MRSIFTYLLLACSIGGFAQSKAVQLLREGNKAYKSGNYERAEDFYRTAITEDKGNFVGNYNLGTALYRQGKYDEAHEQFVASVSLEDDPRRIAKAYHNSGNAMLQQRKWVDAISQYKQALINNPKDEKSRYNLAYAQKMLKENKNSKKDPNNKDENKDQQKGDDADDGDKKKNNDDDQGKKDDKKDGDDGDQQDQREEQQDKEGSKSKRTKNTLTKEEAKRLLDASRQAERQTQAKVVKKKKEKVKIEKDW